MHYNGNRINSLKTIGIQSAVSRAISQHRGGGANSGGWWPKLPPERRHERDERVVRLFFWCYQLAFVRLTQWFSPQNWHKVTQFSEDVTRASPVCQLAVGPFQLNGSRATTALWQHQKKILCEKTMLLCLLHLCVCVRNSCRLSRRTKRKDCQMLLSELKSR